MHTNAAQDTGPASIILAGGALGSVAEANQSHYDGAPAVCWLIFAAVCLYCLARVNMPRRRRRRINA